MSNHDDLIFSRNLKHFMETKGKNQIDIANGIGVSPSIVSYWIRGEKIPRIDKIKKLAEFFGCEPYQLLDDQTTREERKPSIQLPVGAFIPEFHRVPIIGEIACGKPIFAEESYEGYVNAADVRCDFALTCHGDSMTPKLNDGDIVLIRQQNDVDDGDIAAVLIDDEATLKHVYHMEHGLTLVAENPAYSPMIFTQENSSSLDWQLHISA